MSDGFNLQRARGTLSGKGTQVRAEGLDVRTGGQTLARAISGMGKAVFGLGQELYAKDAKVKADDAEVSARLSMVQFMREVRAEDDVTKWDKLFKQHGQRVMQARPKHAGAVVQYDSTVKSLIPIWEQMYEMMREGKLEDNMLASSIAKVDKLRKAATLDSMPQTIKYIRKELKLRDSLSFSISRTETEKLLLDVPRDVQMSAAEKLALREPNNVIARIKAGKIEGFDSITDAQDVIRIENMARRTIGLAEERVREAREKLIDGEQGRLVRLARERKLTDDIIRGSALPEFGTGSKQTFYSILDAQVTGRWKESDGEVEAKILDQIRNPRSDITPRDISALVGKGLSIDDADRMISRLDVYKGFWFGRADRFLKESLGWSDEATKFLHPEGALSYQLSMNELFDAIEKEKLKDRDILDRAASLSVPYLVDYWEKVLMLSPEKLERLKKMLGTKAPKVKSEPKSKSPKKKTRTETEKSLDDIWK